MPSINVDLSFFSHRKTIRLSAQLGDQAIACLLKLWCYVGEHDPESGSLDDMVDCEIEYIAGWKGDPGVFVRVLISVGFIDIVDGKAFIHGWREHAKHLIVYRNRAKKAAAAKWASQQISDASSSASCNASSIHQAEAHSLKSISYASSIARSDSSIVPIQCISMHSNAMQYNAQKSKSARTERMPTLPNELKAVLPVGAKIKFSQKRQALEEFTVTDDIRKWAMKELSVEIPDDVAAEFKDYWKNVPDKKLRTDWEATFKGNIRRLVRSGILKPRASDVFEQFAVRGET